MKQAGAWCVSISFVCARVVYVCKPVVFQRTLRKLSGKRPKLNPERLGLFGNAEVAAQQDRDGLLPPALGLVSYPSGSTCPKRVPVTVTTRSL